jgi:RHS repeat-associated protein
MRVGGRSVRAARRRNCLRRGLALIVAIAALLLAQVAPALAATHVSANITVNTTWTSAGSPYIIDPSSGIQVTNGATLTMLPGVVVKFQASHLAKLNFAGGSLNAVGTQANPVVFTSIEDDLVGGDSNGDGASVGLPGDWTGLQFSNATPNLGLSSTMSNVVVRYGGYGSSPTNAAVWISGPSTPFPSLTASHATITNNQQAGINDGGTLVLSDSTIQNNGGNGLVVASDASARVERTSLSNNGSAGFAQNRLATATSAPATTIFDSTLTGNAGAGIYLGGIAATLPAGFWPYGQRNNIYGNTVLGGTNRSGLNANSTVPPGDWWNNYWGSDVGYTTYEYCPSGHLAYPGDTRSSPKGPISHFSYIVTVQGRQYICVKDREVIEAGQFSPMPFSAAPVVPASETLGGPGPSPYANTGAGFLDDPVNTATGNFTHSETDLSFPQTVGPELKFVRTYNSLQASPCTLGTGSLGTGWSASYSDSLAQQANGDIVFTSADGSSFRFTKIGSAYAGAPGVTATLVAINDGWELTRADQTKLVFDGAGRLTAIKDRNGLALGMSYDLSGRLTQVTDAVGRYLELLYWSPADGSLLHTVLSSDGRRVEYAYGSFGPAAGRLDEVQDARGTFWDYSYDANGFLNQELGQRGAGQEQVFKVAYDSSGRVTDRYDAFNNDTTFAYDSASHTTTVTDPTGAVRKDVYQNGLLVQRIDPLNHTTSFSYDADFNLVSTTDPNGKTTSMAYDANGNMLSRTTPAPLSYTEAWTYNARHDVTSYVDGRGHTTTYRYDGNGNLTSVTRPGSNTTSYAYDNTTFELIAVIDPRNRTTSYGYDAHGDLTSVTDPDGNETTYAYNAAGCRIALVSPNGNVSGGSPGDYLTSYSYNGAGSQGCDKPASVTDPLNHTNSYTYDQVGNLLSVTNPLGKTTSFTYNDANELVGKTFPDGSTISSTYTSRGELASVTDQLGHKTTYTYDAAGHLIMKVTPRGNLPGANPADYTWTYGYDANGNLTSLKDPLNHETDYGYDVLNRQTSITDPLGHKTDYGYDADSNLTSVTDPLTHTTSYGYDDLNRRVSMTDARGKTWSYGYDADGNLTSVTDPLGNNATFGYDDAGRLSTSVDPRGNVSGGNPSLYQTSYSYDPNGNRVAVTDPLGHVTVWGYDHADRLTSLTDPMSHAIGYGYDAANRLTTVTAPDLSTTTYGYDDVDNLTSRTDAKLHTTRYGYDLARELTSVTNPLSKTWTFSYDADGNLTSRVDAIANDAGSASLGTTTYSFDRAERLSGIDYSDSTPDVGFTYDAANRLTQMSDGAGTESFGYDAANRLTSTTRGADNYGYEYNPDNQLTQTTYPDSTAVNLTHDDAGELATLTSGSQSVSYSYDPAGNLTGRMLSDGSTETRNYDRAGRLSEISTTAGATLVNEQVTRDADGAPTQITRSGGNVETYGYDSSGRLTRVCYQASCPNSNDPQIDWTYDKVGNRLTETRPSGTVSYSYNAGDELTSSSDGTTTTNYSYDADGRETGKGAASFGYDMAGDLTSATVGGATTTYGYDGTGNRLSASSGSSTTNYSWDKNALSVLPQLALEKNGAGSLIRRFLYDATGPLQMQTPTTAYTYLQDNHGSVAALTTAGSNVVTHYSYEPFGARTATGTPPDNPLGFHGQYQDLATGVFNLRARQYDSADGRFLSTDPVAPALTEPYVSAYVYANDQPTLLMDPSGMLSARDLLHAAERTLHYGGMVINWTVDGYVAQIQDTYECIFGVLQGEMRGVTRQCMKAAVLGALMLLPGGGAAKSAVWMLSRAGGARIGGRWFTEHAAKGVDDVPASVRHYTTAERARQIERSGEIRVNAEGKAYFTPDRYETAAEAQARLALPTKPEGYFEVPFSRLPDPSPFTRVPSGPGGLGGGLECIVTCPTDVSGVPFRRIP